MKKINLVCGFSLIEMLVVITLFAFMAFFVTQSVSKSFQGAQKADAQGKVRDNLDYAASVVERNLRNAKSIITCDTNMTTIDYVDQNGVSSDFTCNTNLNPGNITWNNNPLTSNEVDLTACSFTCSQPSPVNPPVVDLQLVGGENTTDPVLQSPITILRRIVLRVY